MKDENKKAENAIKLLALLAVLFLMWGATACKKIQYIQGETVYKEVKVVVRDTSVVTQADTATINALLHCDSAYNVVLDELATENGARLMAEAKLKRTTDSNGVKHTEITFECKEDSLIQVIHLKDSIIQEITERNIIEKERVPKKENSPFARFCIIWFFVTVIWTVILIANKIYKFLPWA